MTEPTPMLLPAPPPGGGFVVLHPSEIANLDLVCAIRSNYPQTQIIVQRPIPEARRT